MACRISYSLLDPWLTVPLKRMYPRLGLSSHLPPESIVLLGHSCAAAAAVGFACSTSTWWGGLVGALGVIGNHLADVFDGTHARATGQCRNGGELLDHFLDPLSFVYCLTGIAIACGRLDLGIAAVTILMATAVLTNIKAKLTGEFTVDAFGPTEFKTLLAGVGCCLSGLMLAGVPQLATGVAWSFSAIIVYGVVQLVVSLVAAVREVNRRGRPADTTEWIITTAAAGERRRPGS